MQPLSPSVRRLYLALFMILFAAILPVAIFFADGWRYKSGYGFVRTGGIYIAVPYPDATVLLNGKEIGRSGFLERSFYVGDLASAAYTVQVEKEGYHPWNRILVVEEQLVTDTQALLVPLETPLVRIRQATTTNPINNSTSTRIVSRTVYQDYLDAFATSTAASTTMPIDESNGVGLFTARGGLVARWLSENAFPPSRFCERPSTCTDEIMLADEPVLSAFFFRNGVVYATKSGKVVFTEVDAREVPLVVPLYEASSSDIRVIDDTLLLKVGNLMYEISL